MDKDEGVRTLASWFGTREFRIKDIEDEDRLWEIAELIGNTRGSHGRRSFLGKRLREMDGYSCAASGNRRLRLVVKERADGSKAAVYQVQEIGGAA